MRLFNRFPFSNRQLKTNKEIVFILRMSSEIQTFYKDKVILITGGTGFVGKVTIEKLLRSTDVKRIYMPIRSKRGQDISERLSLWKKELVFQVLLQQKPNALERVIPIAGDCLLPDLGINETDRKLLADEVQIVIHGAATVRFNEKLHVALAINTRATRLLVQLAKEMSRLEAFVHVSTAYSQCVMQHIDEGFNSENLNCSADEILALSEKLSDELLDNIAPTLMGKYPNTYTFTKALAEQVVILEGSDLPVCIFRPGIIMPANKEPVSGWIDNTYGPVALVYGAAYGVLRITILDRKSRINIVPVDYTANAALASAWQTANTTVESSPLIYNFTINKCNAITQADFIDKVSTHGPNYPLNNMIWYPFLHTTSLPWLFNLAAFFYHTIPGYVFDMILRLTGRKPRLVKIYRKVHKQIGLLTYFMTRLWSFETHNTTMMWNGMTSQDRQLYNFDMEHLAWDEYFNRCLLGIRQYICKEPPTAKSIQMAQKIYHRLFLLHRLFQFILGCLVIGILRTGFKVIKNNLQIL